MNKERVAVTGSSGRVGRAINWRLSNDHDVIGLDIAPSSSTKIVCDVTKGDILKKSFEGVSTVYHCAALHAPHVDLIDDRDFYRINVEATRKVCDAARLNGVKKIVFTSTTALYGYTNLGEGSAAWIDELSTPKPRTIYHKTKLEAEEVLRNFASEETSVRVLRMSRCFPEPAPVMAAYRLHRGVDYRDVAEAHFAAAVIKDSAPLDLFVISGKTPFVKSDCKELFETAAQVIKRKIPQLAEQFEKRGWTLPDSIDRVYDSS